ncbi:MAG: STAS domain-containing protein [bacterium]
MFRMKTVYENDLTAIVKIEGEITEEHITCWTEEIRKILQNNQRQIILEICEVTFICPRAVEAFKKLLTSHVFLLNCPTFVKNMLYSAGMSINVLD